MDSNKSVMAYFKKLTQRIEYTMPPGSASSYSLSYSRQLEAGEKVSGFTELTGEDHSGDEYSTWYFQIIGPLNKAAVDWEGNIVTRQRYDFSFTAEQTGQYTIIVRHISRYSKNLIIEIQPPGWSSSPVGS